MWLHMATCFRASGRFEEPLTNLTVARRRRLKLEEVTSIPDQVQYAIQPSADTRGKSFLIL